jgi:pimeloyl-ACP methyl ester carboxylesterase
MDRKVLIVVIVLYVFGSISHIYSLNFSWTHRTEEITIEIQNPTENPSLFTSYEKKIEIIFPKESIEKYPVIILVHGDNTDYKSFNLLIRQLLAQNFAVVVQNFDFNGFVLFELNETLNYLLSKPNIDNNSIGLIGHSHGSHYAFLFSLFRSSEVKSVILMNFGAKYVIYNDFWPYFPYLFTNTTDPTFPVYQQMFQFPMNATSPKNLLIISDRMDPNYIHFEYNIEQENIWNITPNAVMNGNFSEDSARFFKVKWTIFIHTSGLYDPEILLLEVNWLRQSFDMEIAPNPFQILFDHIIQIILILLNNMCGILLLIVFGTYISKNPEIIKKKNEVKLEKNDLFSEETYNLTKYSPDFRKTSVNNAILQEMLSRITFELFMFILLTLFVNYMINPARAMIYVPERIYRLFENLFVLNQNIANIIFTSSLSFNFMYFWIIIVLFVQAIFVSPVIKVRSKSKLQNVLNDLVIFGILLCIFIIVSYCQIIFWTGINIPNALINMIIRFMIAYIFIGIVFRYYLHCKSIGNVDKEALLKSTLLLIFLYIPSLFPKLDAAFLFYIYFIFFFVPFILVICISIFLLRKKKSILLIAVLSFLILLVKDMLFAFIIPVL